jgi:spermidine/putrescine transport system permease protein
MRKAGTLVRPARAAPRGLDARRRLFPFLLTPPVLYLALFLVVPILLMTTLSFRPELTRSLFTPWEPTIEHYEAIIETPSYLRLLLTSTAIAAIVAGIATVLAYPLAYFLRFQAGNRATFYLLLLLLPFWTSYLLRVVAWRLMLGQEGVLNSFLLSVGLISDPISELLYNRTAVVVTLIYVWIPFVALPILAALQRVDPALHEAAGDLYARPVDQFVRVTLPLSMPGVLVAFFLVFVPTIGEYVTPMLVGGPGGSMYGNIIQDFFTRATNWPLGSAFAVVMLVATLVLAVMGTWLIKPARFLPR